MLLRNLTRNRTPQISKIVDILFTQNYFAIAELSAILQVQYLDREALVIRKCSANARFSVILLFSIAGLVLLYFKIMTINN